jgi:hypothetical protein
LDLDCKTCGGIPVKRLPPSERAPTRAELCCLCPVTWSYRSGRFEGSTLLLIGLHGLEMNKRNFPILPRTKRLAYARQAKQKDPRRVSISLLCDLKRRACRHLNLGMAPQLHEKTLSVGRPGYCGNHVRRHPGARLAAGPDLRCGVFLRNEQ